MKTRAGLLITAFILIAMLSPLLFTNAHALTCPTPCNLNVYTNVPSSDASVTVIARGYPTPQTLNHTYTYGNGTTNWVEVQNTNIIGASGARYIFRQWNYNNYQWDTNPNMTTPEMLADFTFTAYYEKLLPLTLSFVDMSGQPVGPPTSVTLTSNLGTTTLTYTSSSVNQYTNHWMDAAVYTVSSMTWQGVQETLGSQTIDLTGGPVNVPVQVQAYSAKMQIVDSSNNPVSGATVTVTLVNGTQTYTFTSDSQGYINLGLLPPGSYNAHIVYQNQDQGSTGSVDPAAYPTYTFKLSAVGGGGVSAPVVSSIVLLTVFGLALFLIILAVRVRKPPPPPMIG
jgi:carboxypeptidase family protein